MLVAGFDTETTGLDVTKEHIIQVAVVLWDTDAKKKKAKVKFDYSVKSPLITAIDPQASEVNGITLEDLDRYGQPAEKVFDVVNAVFSQADAIVAHNGNLFDKPMFENNCRRYSREPVQKLWIDTSCDIQYPAHIQTRKLVHLAAEHGFVNPFPHDATSDVLTMLRIADVYDWAKTLEWAKAPSMVVVAQFPMTSQQGFTTHKKEFEKIKDAVKAQSYRFDFNHKIWTKSIKVFQLAEIQKAARDNGFTALELRARQ